MTGRRATRALLAACLGLTLLVAGCGVRSSGVITGRPAPDGAAQGGSFYFVRNGEPALVLRPQKQLLPPEELLAELVAGPSAVERARGISSEVPADLVPVRAIKPTVDPPGLAVELSGPVTTMSEIAVVQIVCTVAVAAQADGRGNIWDLVTLHGTDGQRGPQDCLVP